MGTRSSVSGVVAKKIFGSSKPSEREKTFELPKKVEVLSRRGRHRRYFRLKVRNSIKH